MHMQMRNRLTGVRPVVDHQPEAGIVNPFLPRNRLRRHQQMPKKRLILRRGIAHPHNFLLGNNQNMHWRLRADVMKSQAKIIFISDPGWNFLRNDPGKNRAHIPTVTVAPAPRTSNL